METFPKEDLNNLRLEYPKDEDFEILHKKLVFSYGYIYDESKFSSPPPKQCECYDALYDEVMSNEKYAKMKKTYDHFDCKDMLKLSKIYLKTDCLLLFDAFEKFQNKNISAELLDPQIIFHNHNWLLLVC